MSIWVCVLKRIYEKYDVLERDIESTYLGRYVCEIPQ